MAQERYHGLDLLRGGAMLLGLVLHGANVLLDPSLLEEVLLADDLDVEPAPDWVAIVTIWIHTWRMPLFFLLGGFFAEMILQARGPRYFLKDRMLRLGGVLALFVPAYNLLWEQDVGTLDHLWFIWVLLVGCVLACAGHAIGPRLGLGPLRFRLSLWWVLAVLVLTCVMNLERYDGIWLPHPETPLDPAWVGWATGLVFFALGQLLYNRREGLTRLRDWPIIALCLTVAGVSFMALLITIDEAAPVPQAAAFAVTTLAWVFGLIGLMHRLLRRANKVVSWLVRISYPVYVLHIWPVMVITGALYVEGTGSALALLIGTIATTALCVVLYYIFIRFTPLEWLFAGYRKAWFKWPFDGQRPS